ncbi:hypothetical protein OB987_18405 [Bacillus cereus]|nr:hypothetical protein [Bacillus cereus]
MNRETYSNISYWGYNYPVNSQNLFRQSPIGEAHSGVGLGTHGLTADQIEKIAACTAQMGGTAISCKYYFLKKKGFTGTPITPELPTSDGVGRFRHYRNDGGVWSIHWHPDTDAHEVHGAIRDKWASLGWEHFGYPITDEYMSGHGRFNLFRAVHLPDKPESSIYWTPQFGAHAISGPIRGRYGRKGWHTGSLGFPISDEQDRPGGGRIQRFEHGSIIWTPETGAYVEQTTPPTPPTTPTTPTTPPTSPTTVGYSKVSIYNCHTDRRSVNIWVNDGSGLHPVTTLNHQYNDSGTCPAGEPYVLELKNGVWNNVVCVDVGAIGCGVNDPTQVACRRYEFSLLGNSNGPEFPNPVIVS